MPFGNRKIYPVQYCHNLKNITPSGNIKFYYFGIFQSLKMRILMKKKIQFILS